MSRLSYGIRKMNAGTIGGQSRVASPRARLSSQPPNIVPIPTDGIVVPPCIPEWIVATNTIGVEPTSVAISLDGATVYCADRNTDDVWSATFGTTFGGSAVVYSAPSGWRVTGVTVVPTGPLVVLTSTFDGHGEVRDFSNNVIYTAGTAISTTGVRAVWNPVDSRLYVLRRPGGGADHILYSMNADGSDVVTEYDSVAATGVDITYHGLLATEDGAIWFNSATSPNQNATRVFGGGEQLAGGGTTRHGIAHVPQSLDSVYQSVGTLVASTTNEIDYNGGVMDQTTVATVFDDSLIIQSAATSDFSKAVAVAQIFGSFTYKWFVMDCPA